MDVARPFQGRDRRGLKALRYTVCGRMEADTRVTRGSAPLMVALSAVEGRQAQDERVEGRRPAVV